MNFLKNLYYLYKLLCNVKITTGVDDPVRLTCGCIELEVWDREVNLKVNGLLQVDPMFISICQHFYDQRQKGSQEEAIMWLYRDIANMTNEQERESAYRAVCDKIDPRYSEAVEAISQAERTDAEPVDRVTV